LPAPDAVTSDVICVLAVTVVLRLNARLAPLALVSCRM